MNKEYISKLLEDGHLFIPEDIVRELGINNDMPIRVSIRVDEKITGKDILQYAGWLSDMTREDEEKFKEATKRRPFFQG